MWETAEPLEQRVEARKQNDIWAMGKIFAAMAAKTGFKWERELLEQAARDAMQINPKSLQDILSQLDTSES